MSDSDQAESEIVIEVLTMSIRTSRTGARFEIDKSDPSKIVVTFKDSDGIECDFKIDYQETANDLVQASKDVVRAIRLMTFNFTPRQHGTDGIEHE